MKIKNLVLAINAPLTLATTASFATSCNERNYGQIYYKTPLLDLDNFYVIDATNFSQQDEFDLIITLESLQGILAKKQTCIYIKGLDHTGEGQKAKTSRDFWFEQWFNNLSEDDKLKIKIISNVDDIWELIVSKKDNFNGKFVLYANPKNDDPNTPQDERDWNKSINLATTISGAEDLLMISDGLKNKAIAVGLQQEEDASKAKSHYIFHKYKDQLNKKLLLNQSPYDAPLRDYAIANKCLTIYLDDEVNYFRDEISDWMDDNYPILGWNKGELGFVASESAHNLPVLCSDHTCNLTFFSHFQPSELKQSYKQPKLLAEPGHHYIAIVMSDGDNLQWMQDNYATDEKWYGSQHRGDFPMTWTITPSAYDLHPQILEYMYANMSGADSDIVALQKDEFIAGPSGYAYANMAQYKDTKAFAKITANYMKKCDLDYINAIDYYDADYQKYKDLLAQDQIKGIVWSNRDLYMSGHGSVDWIYDKPIVSMRYGLWSNPGPDGTLIHPELSPKAIFEDIRSWITNPGYPDSLKPDKIDAYTIITANSWAQGGQMGNPNVENDGISNLVKLFQDSPDTNTKVKFVTLSQILELITDNVEHKSAVPKKFGPVPDVPD